MVTKGIVLAGGTGSRLYPITKGISKQLLPIYDKPMIYYPISALMLAGIRDILIITTPTDLDSFQRLLTDGSDFGIRLSYAVQPTPDGLAQAFLIGRDFIGKDNVCLVLGDNIFFGSEFPKKLQSVAQRVQGATLFAYRVTDPQRFGVIEFDQHYNILSIEEKPKVARSNWVTTGIYFYDNRVIEYAQSLQPSARGELEITDINKRYLAQGELSVELLGHGFAWLDTGTCDSLIEASQFIATLEKRQSFKVSCLEEIAFRKGWISKAQLEKLAQPLAKNDYGQYLLRIAQEPLI